MNTADANLPEGAIPNLALQRVLPNLVSLRSLRLVVVLQGYLPPGAERDRLLGPQWTNLCLLLAAHATCSHLEKISVLIHIRALDYYAADAYLSNARELRRSFRDRVYPVQFEELEKQRAIGVVKFSFKVEVSVGDSIADFAGQTSLLT